MTNPCPLWRVMDAVTKAAWNDGANTAAAKAAELDAIAMYLFDHRQGAAATLLLNEAKRAEAGE
jgi:hypothetical protein